MFCRGRNIDPTDDNSNDWWAICEKDSYNTAKYAFSTEGFELFSVKAYYQERGFELNQSFANSLAPEWILEAYHKDIFEISEHFIKVVVPFENAPKMPIIVNGNENGIETKMIRALSQKPNAAAKELSLLLKISMRKVARVIKTLKEDDKISHVGSDRKGYWKLINSLFDYIKVCNYGKVLFVKWLSHYWNGDRGREFFRLRSRLSRYIKKPMRPSCR